MRRLRQPSTSPNRSDKSDTSTNTSNRSSRIKRTSAALLLVLVALGLLAFRAYDTLVLKKPPDILHLDEHAPAITPPPLQDDDRQVFAAGLRQLETYRNNIQTAATGPSIRLDFARKAIAAGDLISAVDSFVEVIANDNAPSIAYDLLGRCQIELAQFHKALATYDRAIAKYPNEAVLYIGKSRALGGLGRRAEVAGPLEIATSKTPATSIAQRIALAAEFDTLGDTNRALAVAEESHASSPGDEPTAVLTAGLLYKLKRYAEAKAIVEHVVSENSRSGGARRILAQMLENPQSGKQDASMAEHYYLQALQINPQDADAAWRLGKSCQEQKRYIQAAYLYGLLLQAIPDSAAGRRQLAQVYVQLGKDREAKEQDAYARRLSERDTLVADLTGKRDRHLSDAGSHVELARAYRKFGQFRKAAAELQAAWALAPGSRTATNELVDVYKTLGLSQPYWLQNKPQ